MQAILKNVWARSTLRMGVVPWMVARAWHTHHMTSHCAFGMDMENLAKQSVVVAGNSSQDQQVENDSSEIEGEEGRKLLPETATDSGKITKIFFIYVKSLILS